MWSIPRCSSRPRPTTSPTLEKNQIELKIPTWDGELYFQYHRGVQTTQSERSSGNRKNEVLILNAEKLASIDIAVRRDVSAS